MPRVAVVGGGISGLAAAHRLRRLLGPDAAITLLEGSRRLGGALRTVELGTVELGTTACDVGAEAFLVRRPEASALVAELGLDAELVHPTPAGPMVRAGGRTVPLPRRTVMGLPASPDDVAGVLSQRGRERLAAEPGMPLRWESGADVSVGKLVRQRCGDEVVDRLVDPLLGGVYAGRADTLGVRATLPGLAAALDSGVTSLRDAAAAALPPVGGAAGPVFGTLRGGLGRLTDALLAASAPTVRLGSPVRELSRSASGWRLVLGSTAQPEWLEADAVLLAVPAPALRRLLAGPVPAAAAAAETVEVASSVVVGLALPADTAGMLPDASGLLIGSGEPHTAKAFTFSSRKWAHARGPGVRLVRGSVGRHGEVTALQRDDAGLVDAVRRDLAELTGVTADPVDTVVARWGGGLPQYAPGHVETVATIESAVAEQPGLAVAGAVLHGVGIPACIATADAAAFRIRAHLEPVR
ncbi:MAG: protoporphyrinogen oxidase [Pseudonocardiaceae bacterium]|nr:protoporphyrinogen oxidase [Pseudonocardiaceae bacterium]